MVAYLSLAAVCFIGRFSPSLSAQPSSEAPPAAIRTFRVICGGNWQAPPIKYDLNKTPVSIETERTMSLTYNCPPENNLVLYNEIPPPPESPPGTRPRKHILATLPLPADQPKSLVVLMPDLSGKISFRAVPDDFKKHPAGTLRILNFSSFPVAVAINSQQYMAPLDSPDVIVPFDSGGTLIQYAIHQGGKWMPAYRRERIARPRLHTYGIVFNFVSEIGAKDDIAPPTSFILFGELAPASRP